jgi:two-component system sensor histidine kinase YesM
MKGAVISVLANNPIKRLLYSMSIKRRLLLYFIILIFLPASIISATTYIKSKDIITQRVYSSIQNNMSMAENSLIEKIENINDIMTLIYFSPELQSILSAPNSYSKPALINEISSLDKILNYHNLSNASQMLLFPKLYVFDRPEYHFYNFSDYIGDLGEIDTTEWYRSLPYQARYSIIGPSRVNTSSGSYDTIRIAKRLYGLNGKTLPYGGLLIMDAAVDVFGDIVDNFTPSPGSSVFVLDGDNRVIIASRKSMLGMDYAGEAYIQANFQDSEAVLGSAEINGADTLAYSKRMPQQGWTIVCLSPVSEMYGELNSLNKVVVFALLVCLALAAGMAIYLSEDIAYPIRKLSQSMSYIKGENFDITLEYKRNDEFSHLIETYKKMVSEIKELINKLYISELKKRKAELVSLQAQINPHFLYNTLDSVNWLALKHNAPEISKMVTCLSDFYRLSLSKGRTIIAVKDEIKQVDSYLEIQRIRYKDKLDYKMDIPRNIQNHLTIKLILQPIVENSILHGIGPLSEGGFISITARQTECGLEFCVSDNGVGADIDSLNTMLDEKDVDGPSRKSYGLKNVNDRIKQTYGDDFGIRFKRNDGQGITAILSIGVISKTEGFS